MLFFLVLAIGVAVFFFARSRRIEHVVSVQSSTPNQRWVFNVREMTAELQQETPVARLAHYQLRRTGDRRWEMLPSPDVPVDPRTKVLMPTMGLGSAAERFRATTAFDDATETWQPCPEQAAGLVEDAYRRYNGEPEGAPE